MVTIDEAQVMLDEIAEELPSGIYKELNGGILLPTTWNRWQVKRIWRLRTKSSLKDIERREVFKW